MGAPTIRKIPSKGLGPKKIDPRHKELWQKSQGQKTSQKPVKANVSR